MQDIQRGCRRFILAELCQVRGYQIAPSILPPLLAEAPPQTVLGRTAGKQVLSVGGKNHVTDCRIPVLLADRRLELQCEVPVRTELLALSVERPLSLPAKAIPKG